MWASDAKNLRTRLDDCRWRVGGVLMWDERATMHRGAGDYHPEEHRVMLRTIVYPN